jgi:transglutaminase-like putative cysteine protease
MRARHDGMGSVQRRQGRLARLRASCHRVLSLHEYPRPILHGLSRRHRNAASLGRGDFAGWFEAYIGGHWYTFDARNNIPRIGRVLIAQGRDAADVPITQTFGPNTLVSFKVWTDEVA